MVRLLFLGSALLASGCIAEEAKGLVAYVDLERVLLDLMAIVTG